MRLLLSAAAATLVLGAAVAVPAATGATGHAARTCTPPKYPGQGYFTTLTVTRTGCATGRKVALGHYRCRLRNGGRKGYCRSRVSGFRCTEGARNAIPTEFNARVTCRKGTARVVFTYQQDT